MVRYTYGLAPLGFGMWLAHYGFHFLTGLYTIIPVTQSALASLGWPVLGRAALDSDRASQPTSCRSSRSDFFCWDLRDRWCVIHGSGTKRMSPDQAIARIHSLGSGQY